MDSEESLAWSKQAKPKTDHWKVGSEESLLRHFNYHQVYQLRKCPKPIPSTSYLTSGVGCSSRFLLLLSLFQLIFLISSFKTCCSWMLFMLVDDLLQLLNTTPHGPTHQLWPCKVQAPPARARCPAESLWGRTWGWALQTTGSFIRDLEWFLGFIGGFLFGYRSIYVDLIIIWYNMS